MSSRSDVLYSAISNDVMSYLPQSPVGTGEYPPDASYRNVASAMLLAGLMKKFIPANTQEPDRVAVEKFRASNKTCADWVFKSEGSWDDLLLGETKRVINDFLHPEGEPLFGSYRDILDVARTGPGASIGATHQSFYAKMFASTLTTTSLNLYLMYGNYCSNYPVLAEAEVNRLARHGLCSIVDSSRISLVPKTVKESRLICTEPSLNMYYQLGIGKLIEDRLKSFFRIDLSSQPQLNQRLAKIGSGTDQYSTIDLSSASDSISLSLCKELFPSWFFETLMETRSPSTAIGSEIVPLNMVSTMGNGFTFPLQTFLFSSIILAAYNVSGIPVVKGGSSANFGCFGDDLICLRESFPKVMRLLKLLGFTANPAKTFCEGPFRESCGTDWFLSQPVRAVYIRKLNSLQDIFVAINLLNEWSARTGIPLIGGINCLRGWIDRDKLLLVPFHENNDAGIRVPSILLAGKRRFDRNMSVLYRRYQVLPKLIRVVDGDFRVPRGMKRLSYNPGGLLTSFLYGEIKNDAFNIRQTGVRRYRPRQACTPFWDYIPAMVTDNGTVPSFERWESTLLINFSTP